MTHFDVQDPKHQTWAFRCPLQESKTKFDIFQTVIEIIPNVNGEVTDVDVRALESVKEGEVLFRIDPTQYQSRVDQLTAQIELSQLNLDRALREDTLLRWSNRAVYGEETKEVEWRSRVALARRLRGEYKKRNTVLTGFTSVKGFTDPSYIRNYRIGALLRSQIWRRYLFMEVEPSYNWRKNNEDDDRTGVWQIVVRFEIAMERDLRRLRDNGDEE